MSRRCLRGEANVHFAPIVSFEGWPNGAADAAMAEACPLFGNWHMAAGNKMLLMIGKAGNFVFGSMRSPFPLLFVATCLQWPVVQFDLLGEFSAGAYY